MLQLERWLRYLAGRGSEESLQKTRDRHYKKALKILLKNDNHFHKLSVKRLFITAILDFTGIYLYTSKI